METQKTKLYQKWWFWFCMVLFTFLIGSIIVMKFSISIVTKKVHNVALEIQKIDSEAMLYLSSSGDTVIVEIPNYHHILKREKIENRIKENATSGGILSNCSKFILIMKSDSGYFYSIDVFSLPDMTKIEDDCKNYIDFDRWVENSGNTFSSLTPMN